MKEKGCGVGDFRDCGSGSPKTGDRRTRTTKQREQQKLTRQETKLARSKIVKELLCIISSQDEKHQFLAELIAEWPEMEHPDKCDLGMVDGCVCGAEVANTARAIARKLAGLEVTP